MDFSYISWDSLMSEPFLRAGVFSLTLGLMMLWEYEAPARPRALKLKDRLFINLGLGFFNMLLLRLTLPILALEAAFWAKDAQWGLLHAITLSPLLQILLTILFFDFLIYFQHFLLHKIPFLWRLHAAHHTDPDVDASTALRFHPVEILFSMGIKISAAIALGAHPLGIIIFEILLSSMAIFNHTNVSLPKKWEGAIRSLVVTPDMHRIHHSVRQGERDSNFGFILSLWDRILGTYKKDASAEMSLGLPPARPSDSTRPLWLLRLPLQSDVLFAKD